METLSLDEIFFLIKSFDYNNKYILIFIFALSAFFIILAYLFLGKKKRIANKNEYKSKPTVDEIIDNDLSHKISMEKNSSTNDYVDVLVAIEEEMAAIRELYVGGYITKGIYISETDKLYEKAKVFGL
tara:strand:+ start:695 stop:1078 length:384 start_codon:yes stop_codon:yes gene_type:complete